MGVGSSLRRQDSWALSALLSLTMLACDRRSSPLDGTSAASRPALRSAISTIRTPTELLDNYGDEVQVAYRLHILLEEQHFRPAPADSTTFKQILTNATESAYARICAAFLLADTDPEARSLLENYVDSKNLRHRFNAAVAIEWFAWGATGNAREWAAGQLVKMVENRSLELPDGTRIITSGYEPNGYDMIDDTCSPLDKVVYTLGEIREPRAISGLKSVIERGQVAGEAACALGKIGDTSVCPFLMSFCWRDVVSCGSALADLKCRSAVPLLLQNLQEADATYVGPCILRDLARIGDESAIPEMLRYVQKLPTGRDRRIAEVILAQLREKDPVQALIALQTNEPDNHVQIEILRGLGRFPGQRAIDHLYEVSLSSTSTLLRLNAISSLGSIHTRPALLVLVSLMETNAPPPTDFDKQAILEGRPADYTRRQAERTLRDSCHRNFGMEPAAWRKLITDEFN